MWQNAHDTYLENRIESADPIQLVRLLYQGATRWIREARRHLASGEIEARSRALSNAHAILTELTLSLDHVRGGELSVRLSHLYDYMQRRLLEANFRQVDEPLAEVLGLLSTLGEAWDGIQEEAAAPVGRTENPWAQAPPPEAAHALSSGGWSL
jgi:flagellar protein FliS